MHVHCMAYRGFRIQVIDSRSVLRFCSQRVMEQGAIKKQKAVAEGMTGMVTSLMGRRNTFKTRSRL